MVNISIMDVIINFGGTNFLARGLLLPRAMLFSYPNEPDKTTFGNNEVLLNVLAASMA